MKSFFCASIISMCMTSALVAAEQKIVTIQMGTSGKCPIQVSVSDDMTIAALKKAISEQESVNYIPPLQQALYKIEEVRVSSFLPSKQLKSALEDTQTCADLQEGATLLHVLTSPA